MIRSVLCSCLLIAVTADAQDRSPTVPACRPEQIKLSAGRSGVAAGSEYSEIIFQNTFKSRCRLESASLHFQQFDDKRLRMPLRANRDVSVNADGARASEVIIGPGQSTAISVQTSNRTGYDESTHCGTSIQIRIFALAARSRPYTFYTTSCGDHLTVSGFHAVSEQGYF